MKNFFGEKIYVLGLESKDTPDWRKNFDSFIPNDKLEFCIKKGAKSDHKDPDSYKPFKTDYKNGRLLHLFS